MEDEWNTQTLEEVEFSVESVAEEDIVKDAMFDVFCKSKNLFKQARVLEYDPVKKMAKVHFSGVVISQRYEWVPIGGDTFQAHHSRTRVTNAGE